MSRMLVAALALSSVFSTLAAAAQPLSDAEIAAQIEKARRLVAVDDEGCIKYPVGDEIIVCGTSEENERQRLAPAPVDNNKIRKGEAVSAVRAACCSPIPKIQPFATSSFGYVPPPATPLEEVLKGLPEPDMIVTNGEPVQPPPLP